MPEHKSIKISDSLALAALALEYTDGGGEPLLYKMDSELASVYAEVFLAMLLERRSSQGGEDEQFRIVEKINKLDRFFKKRNTNKTISLREFSNALVPAGIFAIVSNYLRLRYLCEHPSEEDIVRGVIEGRKIRLDKVFAVLEKFCQSGDNRALLWEGFLHDQKPACYEGMRKASEVPSDAKMLFKQLDYYYYSGAEEERQRQQRESEEEERRRQEMRERENRRRQEEQRRREEEERKRVMVRVAQEENGTGDVPEALRVLNWTLNPGGGEKGSNFPLGGLGAEEAQTLLRVVMGSIFQRKYYFTDTEKEEIRNLDRSLGKMGCRPLRLTPSNAFCGLHPVGVVEIFINYLAAKNLQEYYRSNGAITREQFINRVSRLEVVEQHLRKFYDGSPDDRQRVWNGFQQDRKYPVEGLRKISPVPATFKEACQVLDRLMQRAMRLAEIRKYREQELSFKDFVAIWSVFYVTSILTVLFAIWGSSPWAWGIAALAVILGFGRFSYHAALKRRGTGVLEATMLMGYPWLTASLVESAWFWGALLFPVVFSLLLIYIRRPKAIWGWSAIVQAIVLSGLVWYGCQRWGTSGKHLQFAISSLRGAPTLRLDALPGMTFLRSVFRAEKTKGGDETETKVVVNKSLSPPADGPLDAFFREKTAVPQTSVPHNTSTELSPGKSSVPSERTANATVVSMVSRKSKEASIVEVSNPENVKSATSSRPKPQSVGLQEQNEKTPSRVTQAAKAETGSYGSFLDDWHKAYDTPNQEGTSSHKSDVIVVLPQDRGQQEGGSYVSQQGGTTSSSSSGVPGVNIRRNRR